MNEKIAEIANECAEAIMYQDYVAVGNGEERDELINIINRYMTQALSLNGEEEPKHLTSEQRQAIFNFFHDKEVVLMDDDFNTIECIVYPRTYPYTLKDEQHSTPSQTKDLLEEVKRRLDYLNRFPEFEKTIERTIYTELIQFSEGGK